MPQRVGNGTGDQNVDGPHDREWAEADDDEQDGEDGENAHGLPHHVRGDGARRDAVIDQIPPQGEGAQRRPEAARRRLVLDDQVTVRHGGPVGIAGHAPHHGHGVFVDLGDVGDDVGLDDLAEHAGVRGHVGSPLLISAGVRESFDFPSGSRPDGRHRLRRGCHGVQSPCGMFGAKMRHQCVNFCLDKPL